MTPHPRVVVDLGTDSRAELVAIDGRVTVMVQRRHAEGYWLTSLSTNVTRDGAFELANALLHIVEMP